MTDKGIVKQLGILLEPIQKGLGTINKRLSAIDKKLDQHSKILDQHQQNFGEINRKLDQHTKALINIEDTMKFPGLKGRGFLAKEEISLVRLSSSA